MAFSRLLSYCVSGWIMVVGMIERLSVRVSLFGLARYGRGVYNVW